MISITLPTQEFSYRAEVKRKLIHLSSLWMPVVIYVLPLHTAAMIFAVLLVNQFAFEIARRQRNGLARLLNRIFTPVLRPHETMAQVRLTGATYVLMAALICTLAFPAPVAVTAMAIMLVADSAASLVGMRYGKTPLMGKTVEGSAAFLITALAVITLIGHLADYGYVFYAGAVAAAVTATAAELVSGILHIDDNLSVPLTAGGAMWLVTSVI